MFPELILWVKIAWYTASYLFDFFARKIQARYIQWQRKRFVTLSESKEPLNIVIVGASFAGYHVAKNLAESLPADSPYHVVVVEPNSHFQFTWLLPRFSVVPGYESKLFIPYGPYIKYGSDRVDWIQDRAVSVTKNEIRLRDSKTPLKWKFLVIATGSGQMNGLPSRVGVEDRTEGIEKLQTLQRDIKAAQNIVIVGGGAAGVEIAADAKETYPEKNITLVHSRQALMSRFETGLQKTSLKALGDLKVKVILNERMTITSDVTEPILRSGEKLKCDLLIDCVGQKPTSNLIAQISPSSVASSGHIKVKPTMQIADDLLPQIYVCGDVADAGVPKPNARSAMMQGSIVADNIVLAVQGLPPKHQFKLHWVQGVIKLTLGLYTSVLHFSDGKHELLKHSKEKHITLMADQTWSAFGVDPEKSDSGK